MVPARSELLHDHLNSLRARGAPIHLWTLDNSRDELATLFYVLSPTLLDLLCRTLAAQDYPLCRAALRVAQGAIVVASGSSGTAEEAGRRGEGQTG